MDDEDWNSQRLIAMDDPTSRRTRTRNGTQVVSLRFIDEVGISQIHGSLGNVLPLNEIVCKLGLIQIQSITADWVMGKMNVQPAVLPESCAYSMTLAQGGHY
ncbi:hypothetical protein VE00_02051 [Pseudogymnoascus sp. WSF 3629]|nr:hypothetical protein VE00_02051 [Pseudogymnoascus sp. WSF 3629]